MLSVRLMPDITPATKAEIIKAIMTFSLNKHSTVITSTDTITGISSPLYFLFLFNILAKI